MPGTAAQNAHSPERRAEPRLRTLKAGKIAFNNHFSLYDCVVRNMTKHGACIEVANTLGVPPVFARELYPFIEQNGARVVFNEVQRQFAMPEPGRSLAGQYSNYTYPYSIHERLKDIKNELHHRQINGVIHYVQAFCHRGIGDIIFRDAIPLPLLTLEGNADFFLNTHTRTRIEAFLDMLQRRRPLLKEGRKSGRPALKK